MSDWVEVERAKGEIARLRATVEHLGKTNQAFRSRIAEDIVTQELISEARELVFIRIEGRKWETRHYKVKRNDPLVKIFNDYAKYEELSLARLTFTSKDKKVSYRGDQSADEVGLRDQETILVWYDI